MLHGSGGRRCAASLDGVYTQRKQQAARHVPPSHFLPGVAATPTGQVGGFPGYPGPHRPAQPRALTVSLLLKRAVKSGARGKFCFLRRDLANNSYKVPMSLREQV